MIVKKISMSHDKSKRASIADLVDYLRDPERGHESGKTGERLLYTGARGFISTTHEAQKAEMIALAEEAVRSKQPVSHYIMSWREGEQPTPEQIERAMDIFLEELGLQGHQCIYAFHGDTDNTHLHIAVNRVHPERLKVVKPNRGFDIEAAHRAIARIEHEQGWQRERNGRYTTLENGDVVRERERGGSKKKPSQKARDFEQRTGQKSAERTAQEEAAEIIKSAKSWQELHERLSERGMRYEKKGSGAIIWVGDQPVKASSVSRDASLSALQKRLGAYQDPSPHLRPRAREPEPVKPDMPGFDAYAKARREHYGLKAEVKAQLDRHQEQERKALAERHKRERQEMLAGRWRGKGEALNALRSVLAARQAAEKAALKEKHRRERERWREKYPPFPDFERWLEPQALAARWRYRDDEEQQARIEGDRHDVQPRDIRACKHEIVGGLVHYYLDGGAGAGGVSFVDHGKQIDIHDWRDPSVTLAALQLSAQKWGSFTVTGNDEYKAMCAKLAAEHGFKITNPELQESIQQERQRIQQERAQAMKSEQLKQFERYAEAVDAERYRVTSIKLNPDGSKQTFILDKRDGVTRGFTPDEIALHMREMQRLQSRGENIYYTPLSDSKHHILIDDMNREKLERLIRAGYQPAVVLESSPGNYQAIITVPKLGTVHDKDVGNRLAERLNREYGDQKLSGCIHPHRAPGFENRKPKHQREDGSYPEVRLLKAEKRECAKTLELARQIDAEYAQRAKQQPQQQQAKERIEIGAASTKAADAYQRHYRDIMRRMSGTIDYSRIDSMIAVRMRVTGHDAGEIAAAIRECAPQIRPADKRESRDWNDYAQRTARYAFSAGGDRQVEQLDKYAEHWRKLEGRAVARSRDEQEREQERHDAPSFGR